MTKLRQVYSITIDPIGGASVSDVCWEALVISRELGVKVFVIHNDKKYEPTFNTGMVVTEKAVE